MLDNVLDATHWPLERQQQEAANKRRVGLGFTGLGDALAMLRLRYDKPKRVPWPPASANSCATPPT
jgi:ribonucleoside-diphosphate reductase alpha chain